MRLLAIGLLLLNAPSNSAFGADLMGAGKASAESCEIRYVAGAGLKLREKADVKSQSLTVLRFNTKVCALKEADGWTNISVLGAQGSKGWIQSTYLSPQSTNEATAREMTNRAIERKDYHSAVTWAERAVEMNESAENLDLLVDVYNLSGDKKRAEAVTDKLLPLTFGFGSRGDSHLKPFSKADCQNFRASYKPEEAMKSGRVKQAWFEAIPNGELGILNSAFMCSNSKVQSLSFKVTGDGTDGEMVSEVRCNQGLVKKFFVGGNGEVSETRFIDLKTCRNLGAADKETISPDQRFLVLTTDAGTTPGYGAETAHMVVLDCGGGFCYQVIEKNFGRERFSAIAWSQPSKLEFERQAVEENGVEIRQFTEWADGRVKSSRKALVIEEGDDHEYGAKTGGKKKSPVKCSLDLSAKPKMHCQ